MDALTQWEVTINLFLQGLDKGMYPVMAAITWLGTEYFYMLIMTVIYWCVDTTLGLRFGLILMLSDSFKSFFKVLFHTPRPYWIDTRVQALSVESSFGMPSGHSFTATVKRKSYWLAAAIILLMGISRMYLGVHFLRDVLLGWLIGALILALFIYFEKPVVDWFTPLTLGLRLAAALASALLMIAAGMAVHAVTAEWVMPAAWAANALAGAPREPIDPTHMEGIFNVRGT